MKRLPPIMAVAELLVLHIAESDASPLVKQKAKELVERYSRVLKDGVDEDEQLVFKRGERGL